MWICLCWFCSGDTQVSDEKKLKKTDPDDIYDTFFSSASKASQNLSLLSFQPFSDTADAVSAATAVLEGKVSKTLKSFLKKELKKAAGSSLAVADKALGVSLKDALSVEGRISGALVEENQTASHGLAWLATYAQSLRQMQKWAEALNTEVNTTSGPS